MLGCMLGVPKAPEKRKRQMQCEKQSRRENRRRRQFENEHSFPPLCLYYFSRRFSHPLGKRKEKARAMQQATGICTPPIPDDMYSFGSVSNDTTGRRRRSVDNWPSGNVKTGQRRNTVSFTVVIASILAVVSAQTL